MDERYDLASVLKAIAFNIPKIRGVNQLVALLAMCSLIAAGASVYVSALLIILALYVVRSNKGREKTDYNLCGDPDRGTENLESIVTKLLNDLHFRISAVTNSKELNRLRKKQYILRKIRELLREL